MNSFSQLGQTVANAVRVGIASLPMYAFQRAQPGLYELFQTYSAKADAIIAISLKSCEEMEAQIRRGGNPYEEWAMLAKGEAWKNQSAANADVVSAKQNVERTGDGTGVRWIGGQQRGGVGQPPIRLVGDLVTAGYSVTFNQPPASQDGQFAAPGPQLLSSRLMSAFRYPSDAARYAQDVLGETEISTCSPPNCAEKGTSTGAGLGPKFEAEMPVIQTTLNTLVTSNRPDYAQLDLVSAPGVAISREVIEALRELPDVERRIVLQRLVSEIAMAKTIDKALAVRQLMMTSLTLPEVTAAEPATRAAREKIATMNRYIEDLMFENRVRKEVVSSTAGILIEAGRSAQAQSLNVAPRRPVDPAPLIDGKVAR